MRALFTLRQRIILTVVVGLISAFCVIGLRASGALQTPSLWQYDLTTEALAAADPVADVALIALSDADLGRWGWPLPDDKLAQIIQATKAAGARTVGLDIYRDVPVGRGRDDLLRALSLPGVVVISRLSTEGAPPIGAPDVARAGFADVPIDPDGVARRALLLVTTEQTVALSFPLQLALNATGQDSLRADPENPRALRLGTTTIEQLPVGFGPYQSIDAAGYQIMVRYRNSLPIVNRFQAQDLLAGQLDLTDKVVLIGITSDTVKDYFSTPLNRRTGAQFTYGVELHAAITQQLIDHSTQALPPLRSLSQGPGMMMIYAAALAASALAIIWPARFGGLALGLIVAVALAASLAYAQQRALLMPVVPVTLAWLLAFLASFVVTASVARRHRRIMVDIFASQMSEDLSAQIWQQRKRLLEGQKPVSRKLTATVLLADIEGSTRIGREMQAQAFMDWITRLLDRLAQIAQHHNGFVEKFTGDGILVVFGAPVPSESLAEQQRDACAALSCALAMQDALKDLNAQKQGPDYRLRIGLNSGEVVAGTLGTSGAMRYNVIGDTVNVAARVEAWTKSLEPDATGNRPLAMTQAVANLVGPEQVRPAGDDLVHDDGQTRIALYFAR